MSNELSTCEACGLPAEAGYALSLCSLCRKNLAERPFPRGIQVITTALVPCILLAMFQFPGGFRAAAAYERGRKAESEGRFQAAVDQYTTALNRFPDAYSVIARRGLAEYHLGQYSGAVSDFRRLEGHELPDEIVAELNVAIDGLASKANAESRKGRPNQ